jgi:hypothetical protein
MQWIVLLILFNLAVIVTHQTGYEKGERKRCNGSSY